MSERRDARTSQAGENKDDDEQKESKEAHDTPDGVSSQTDAAGSLEGRLHADAALCLDDAPAQRAEDMICWWLTTMGNHASKCSELLGETRGWTMEATADVLHNTALLRAGLPLATALCAIDMPHLGGGMEVIALRGLDTAIKFTACFRTLWARARAAEESSADGNGVEGQSGGESQSESKGGGKGESKDGGGESKCAGKGESKDGSTVGSGTVDHPDTVATTAAAGGAAAVLEDTSLTFARLGGVCARLLVTGSGGAGRQIQEEANSHIRPWLTCRLFEGQAAGLHGPLPSLETAAATGPAPPLPAALLRTQTAKVEESSFVQDFVLKQPLTPLARALVDTWTPSSRKDVFMMKQGKLKAPGSSDKRTDVALRYIAVTMMHHSGLLPVAIAADAAMYGGGETTQIPAELAEAWSAAVDVRQWLISPTQGGSDPACDAVEARCKFLLSFPVASALQGLLPARSIKSLVAGASMARGPTTDEAAEAAEAAKSVTEGRADSGDSGDGSGDSGDSGEGGGRWQAVQTAVLSSSKMKALLRERQDLMRTDEQRMRDADQRDKSGSELVREFVTGDMTPDMLVEFQSVLDARRERARIRCRGLRGFAAIVRTVVGGTDTDLIVGGAVREAPLVGDGGATAGAGAAVAAHVVQVLLSEPLDRSMLRTAEAMTNYDSSMFVMGDVRRGLVGCGLSSLTEVDAALADMADSLVSLLPSPANNAAAAEAAGAVAGEGGGPSPSSQEWLVAPMMVGRPGVVADSVCVALDALVVRYDGIAIDRVKATGLVKRIAAIAGTVVLGHSPAHAMARRVVRIARTALGAISLDCLNMLDALPVVNGEGKAKGGESKSPVESAAGTAAAGAAAAMVGDRAVGADLGSSASHLAAMFGSVSTLAAWQPHSHSGGVLQFSSGGEVGASAAWLGDHEHGTSMLVRDAPPTGGAGSFSSMLWVKLDRLESGTAHVLWSVAANGGWPRLTVDGDSGRLSFMYRRGGGGGGGGGGGEEKMKEVGEEKKGTQDDSTEVQCAGGSSVGGLFALCHDTVRSYLAEGQKGEKFVWRVQAPPGHTRLGDTIDGRDGPCAGMLVIASSTEGVVAAPLGYTQCDKVMLGSGKGNTKVRAWRPIAPPGFVAMGVVFTCSDNQPSTSLVGCVAETLVKAMAPAPHNAVKALDAFGSLGPLWCLPGGLVSPAWPLPREGGDGDEGEGGKEGEKGKEGKMGEKGKTGEEGKNDTPEEKDALSAVRPVMSAVSASMDSRWFRGPVGATNANFGDPVPGLRKVLVVEMADGSMHTAKEHTDERVRGHQRILRAWYGDCRDESMRWSSEHGKDVTDKFVELAGCALGRPVAISPGACVFVCKERPRLMAASATTIVDVTTTVSRVAVGVWTHVAVTVGRSPDTGRGEGGVSLYVDGERAETEAFVHGRMDVEGVAVLEQWQSRDEHSGSQGVVLRSDGTAIKTICVGSLKVRATLVLFQSNTSSLLLFKSPPVSYRIVH